MMSLSPPKIASRANGHTKIRILAYHAVREDSAGVASPSISLARLSQQLKLLRWLGFSFISLDDWLDYLQQGKPVPRRAVTVTFDDGYEEMAGPFTQLLADREIPATMFVVTSLLGDWNRWDLPEGKPMKLLGPQGLRGLAPVIGLGSHCRSHASLAQLDSGALCEELALSKKELEQTLGLPIRYVAYPYGEYDERVGRAARDAGYQLGLGVQPGLNDGGSDRFHLHRICILSHDPVPRFFGKVLFPRAWLALAAARAAMRRGWNAATGRWMPPRLWPRLRKVTAARSLTRTSS